MQCETAMVVISHKFGFIYSQTTPLSSFIVLAIHDFNIQPCLIVGTPRKYSIAHPETHLFQLVTRAHPMPLTSFESTTSKSTSSSWVGRKIRGSSSFHLFYCTGIYLSQNTDYNTEDGTHTCTVLFLYIVHVHINKVTPSAADKGWNVSYAVGSPHPNLPFFRVIWFTAWLLAHRHTHFAKMNSLLKAQQRVLQLTPTLCKGSLPVWSFPVGPFLQVIITTKLHRQRKRAKSTHAIAC